MPFATSAQDILRYRSHRRVHRFFRNRALDLMGFMQSPHQEARLSFLSFHFLFEDEHDNFRRLLEYVSNHFLVVSYSEAVRLVKEGGIEENTVCFSADDGFENYLEAARIMNEFDMSGCVFVCPGIVGVKDFASIKTFNNDRLKGPALPFMDWDQISEVIELGHEVGNHSMDHLNLGIITEEQLSHQITEAHKHIVDRLGSCTHFAWPYGKPATVQDALFPILKSLDYDSVASTIRGHYLDRDHELVYLKRNNFEPYWPLNHTKYFLHSDRYA